MRAALRPAATGTVIIQAKMMLAKRRHSTVAAALTLPMATTDPTLQCVVLIGIPMLDASSTVAAAPSSILNPLKARNNKQRIIMKHTSKLRLNLT